MKLYQILPLYGCSLELLDILHDVFDNVFDRDDQRYMSTEHKGKLSRLELRLRYLIQHERVASASEDDSPSHAMQIAECYRLATLLYLGRVARNSRRNAPEVMALTSESFSLLRRMRVCDRPWPLFVLAMEAVSDDQRRLALIMLERLQKFRSPADNSPTIRQMVEAAWAQEDLAQPASLDALDLYRAVISANRVPPAFV